MQYERLVNWAQGVLQERQLSQKTVTIWASVECSNHIALKQVKAGRKLRGKARYEGYEQLDCPVIVQINDCGSFNKKMVLTS
ncbi:MAG: hypothetical protein MUE54_11240, partial [Anaerolineae bacterium]|nr:hypothetical protein [Anaerolineae bacterium]